MPQTSDHVDVNLLPSETQLTLANILVTIVVMNPRSYKQSNQIKPTITSVLFLKYSGMFTGFLD